MQNSLLHVVWTKCVLAVCVHIHLIMINITKRQLNVSRPSWRPAVWEEKSGWPGREEPPAGRVCPSPPPAGGPAAGAELLSSDRTDHSRSEPDSLQHWTWMIQKTHMNHHCEEEKHQIFSCDSEPVNQNTQHAKYMPFFPLNCHKNNNVPMTEITHTVISVQTKGKSIFDLDKKSKVFPNKSTNDSSDTSVKPKYGLWIGARSLKSLTFNEFKWLYSRWDISLVQDRQWRRQEAITQ